MKTESFTTRDSVLGGKDTSQSATSLRLGPVTAQLSQAWLGVVTMQGSEFTLMLYLTICAEEVKKSSLLKKILSIKFILNFYAGAI